MKLRHYPVAAVLNTNPHNKEAFGTGPYRFKEWLPHQRIVLERNENYWGAKPNFNQIYYRIVKESAVRFQMLKNKKIDISGLTPVQWTTDVPKPPSFLPAVNPWSSPTCAHTAIRCACR